MLPREVDAKVAEQLAGCGKVGEWGQLHGMERCLNPVALASQLSAQPTLAIFRTHRKPRTVGWVVWNLQKFGQPSRKT